MADVPSQAATATRERITRLAVAVAGLRDGDWAAELSRMGAGAPPADHPVAPTFASLAGAGVDAVEALAADGRWSDAAGQADRLTRVFAAQRHTLHPVVGESFDGLRAAAHAGDAEELADFVDLLREMFDAGGPAGG